MKSLTALLALALCLGLIGCGVSKSSPQTQITPTPSGQMQLEVLHPPTGGSTGDAVQTYLMSNSAVAGANVFVEWAAVDQGPTANPQYVWTSIDSTIQPWTAMGKKVNLIVWDVADATTNTSTPSYVIANLGSANWTTCDGEVTPNYFDAAFQVPYKAFMQQVIAHYGSNPSIGYIRFGLAQGGETYPNQGFDSDPVCSAAFTAWGWTPTSWISYLTSMLAYETTLNSPKQLMVGINTVNMDTSIPDQVAAFAVSNKMGFGSQGLQESDIASYAAGQPCTADWCNLFNQYQGQVPLELQTATQSDPTGGGVTGSLVALLPFAAERHADIMEIYYQDWLTAYDPSYPGYDPAYATAFASAAAPQ
ncbi:MAG: hypothetical protein ABSA78_02075 [Candidatus Sulfotelmatobacter sp.]